MTQQMSTANIASLPTITANIASLPTIIVYGVDEDGVQHQILVTTTGKIITRITGLDENDVQRTILLNTDGEIIVDAKVARYQATPVTLADGTRTYLLLDNKGRLVNAPIGFCQENISHTLEMEHTIPALDENAFSLRTTHVKGIKSLSVTSPGVAYANGVNALCLGAPTVETNELEIEDIYISAGAVGDFYIVAENLGILPGATTANVFDLVGIKGEDVVNTSDTVWAFFNAAGGKSGSSGEFHFDITAGHELYLIAPNIAYSFVISYVEEYIIP